MNMNDRGTQTVLYTNSKNHRERRKKNKIDESIQFKTSLKQKRRKKDNVYGNFVPKITRRTPKDKKKNHNCQRNTHKILKWINLLIKEMVESFIQVEPAFPFPSLGNERCFSSPPKPNVGSFSFPPTATFSCNALPPVLHVTQEFRDGPTACWEKPERQQIPAAAAHWLTWGLRAWYSPSKLGRSGMSRLQQRIISSKRDGGHSGGP